MTATSECLAPRFDFSAALSYPGTVLPASCGAVAQLGERLNGIQEVAGSIPVGSTKKS